MNSPQNEKITCALIKAVGMCVSTGLMGIICWRMLRYLDPHREQSENAKRRLQELKKILNLKPSVELNSHEIRLATQIVLPNQGVDIEDVGGYSQLLAQLENTLIIPLLLRASAIQSPSSYYSPPKGILLHGPPGCGKTLIARALAKRAKAYFLNFDIAALSDMWYGETAKLTKALFTLTQKIQPCIIFIDEIDSILRSRSRYDHEATSVMKTQFMSLWDGFLNSNSAVIIIGATNRPVDVDEAILRRLPFKIHVPKPDAESREQILRVLLRDEKTTADFDYQQCANATDSLSGSDLKEVIRMACLKKYHETVVSSLNESPDQINDHINDIELSDDEVVEAALLFKQNNISNNDLTPRGLILDPLE